MWLPLVFIVGSFLLGVVVTAVVLYRFFRVPANPSQVQKMQTENGVPAPVRAGQVQGAAERPNAFEEKTRQVNLQEFAELLHLDHEEIVAEPVPVDSEEQLAMAREDSRQLQRVIEQKGGPLGSGNPQVMISVVPPSRYIYSSHHRACGLPN